MVQRVKHFSFLLFLGGWIVAVAFGFWFSASYEKGAAAEKNVASWPPGLSVTLDRSRENLILVAHPRCPCTDATLDELISIMTRCREGLRVSVLFTVPAVKEAGWTDSDLERAARRIPGVTVIDDLDGRMAARLGATTSGEVLLFDGAGRLLFSGGITGARGHAGWNEGEAAVIELASSPVPRISSVRHAPVFGCSLVGAGGDEKGKGL